MSTKLLDTVNRIKSKNVRQTGLIFGLRNSLIANTQRAISLLNLENKLRF